MSTTRKYYEILGLSPFASRKEITAAIARLREKDSEGHYDATLNLIEKSLLPQKGPLSQSESATPAQEKPDDDNATLPVKEAPSDDETEKDHPQDSAQAISSSNRLPQEPLQLYSYDDEANATGKKKKILLAGLLLIVVTTAAIIASKRIYQNLKSKEQARQASAALFAAKEQIEAYIREHKTFPTTFSFQVADTAPYTLHLQDKQIFATFNRNATAALQNRQIVLTQMDQLHLGLIWRCDVLSGFPERYRPENCY